MNDLDVPQGWSRARVDAVVANIRAKALPSDHPQLPFVGMDAVESQTSRLLGTIPAAGMKSAGVHFLPGDVLYGRLRPYLNKVLVAKFEGLASAEFIPLTPERDMSPEFVRYRLSAADFVSFASHLDEGDRPRVDYGQIGAFECGIPPAGEQVRIVAAIEQYLTALDAAVVTLERVQRNLKRYRASVLNAAVEGRLVPTEAELARAEGRDYKPASKLLERILAERRKRWEQSGRKGRYEEPAEPNVAGSADLPEGWCWASVDQLTDGERSCGYGVLVPGPEVDGGIPLVRVGDIGEGSVDQRHMKRIAPAIAAQFSRTFLRGGEVLMSLVGTIGRTAVAPGSLAGANVARAIGVIPVSGLVEPRWVEHWFRSPRQRSIMDSKSHEVARKTLNLEDVRAANVALPPLAEQGRILEAVSDLLSVADASLVSTETDVSRLSRLRQSILRWAFEGKLVDHDPNDEPAFVLLERIRARRAAAAPAPRSRVKRPRAKVTR